LPILNWLGFLPEFFLNSTILFILFLPIIFFCSFTLFSLISSFSFWFTEVYSIRWSLTVTFRFLSGMMVPIDFFPEFFQKILFYLPFQHLVFTPIRLMQNAISLQKGLESLMILIIWTVFLSVVRSFIWKKGASSYESTGI